ncbi:MAG: hypothetical protein HUK21_02995 [Fibrobacteraceae bacterium]|nr:hypothetical protein [Fibrobacteraceae bacterium]
MPTPFKINHINPTINYEKISAVYDFFEISTSEKYFDTGAKILDDMIIEKSVIALQFDLGKNFYVMMKHNEQNDDRIKKVIKDNENLSYTTKEAKDIPLHRLIQLFLNGLYRSESEHPLLKFNNLGGHLYCFHPNWLKKRPHSESVIWKIPCLDVKVSWQMNLTFDVKTFSALPFVLKNTPKEERSKILKLPRYTLSDDNTLHRYLEDDEKRMTYVQKAFGAKKTTIPFITLWPINEYTQCKMGVVGAIIEKFNHTFESLIKLKCDEIQEYKLIDIDKEKLNENVKYITEALQNQPIKIIDEVKDDSSAKECNLIQLVIEEFYGIKASIGRYFDKKAINISLIHKPEFYEESNIKDPHSIPHENCIVQHLTVEILREFIREKDSGEIDLKFIKPLISTIIHNLLIKKDLETKKIALFDWNQIGLTEKISFGVAKLIKDTKNAYQFYFMDIDPNGAFEISEVENDLFSQNQYSNCIEIYEKEEKSSRSRNEPIQGIIQDQNGNINIIRDTEQVTLPEFDKIMQDVAEGKNARRVAVAGTYLNACTNIKMFENDDKFFYCVGIKQTAIPQKIQRAVNIREIQSFNESAIIFEKLLPLMSVEFVRNGQMTVIPFPFKYLREWIEVKQKNSQSR